MHELVTAVMCDDIKQCKKHHPTKPRFDNAKCKFHHEPIPKAEKMKKIHMWKQHELRQSKFEKMSRKRGLVMNFEDDK